MVCSGREQVVRVSIDVRIAIGHGAGVQSYVTELCLALAQQPVELQLWCAVRQAALVQERLSPPLLELAQRCPLAITPVPNALLYSPPALWFWRRWPQRLPTPRLIPRGVDVHHATYWPLPLTNRTPQVLTIHDLLGLRHPEWATPEIVEELRTIVALAPRAAQVICDSEATRMDVLAFTKLPPERVTTVHLGVSPRWAEPVDEAACESVRTRLGVGERYLMVVGTREPRKNLGRVIDAYDRLCDSGLDDWALVMTGAEGWGRDELAARLGRPRRGRIVTTGYLPGVDLPALLHGASALCYPSLGEGFGLPPLEAMAAGCPVVTSNLSSLPEVVGDAAVTVDPHEVEAIADGLRQVLTDAALAAELRRKGRDRAAEFTWRRTAEQTVAAYQRALGDRGRRA